MLRDERFKQPHVRGKSLLALESRAGRNDFVVCSLPVHDRIGELYGEP
jgi:hypothetical protein